MRQYWRLSCRPCQIKTRYFLGLNGLGLTYEALDNTYETIALSHDHKPTDPIERDRIVAAGGMVQIGRVDGQLALSRAFGDRALKVPMNGDRAARKVLLPLSLKRFSL